MSGQIRNDGDWPASLWHSATPAGLYHFPSKFVALDEFSAWLITTV